MKTAVFLQCRLDSTRLPGKALKILEDKTLVEHAMAALSKVHADSHVLLTTDDSFEILAALAPTYGFQCFAGPKEDVLLRFILASQSYGIDTIIRATADNPLVSARLANSLVKEHLLLRADYSGYLGIPLGTGVEILSTRALFTANQETKESYDHEHVAPYLYKNPDKFLINRPDLTEQWGFGDAKISVDTPQDFTLMQEIFSELYQGGPIEIDRLISFLKKKGSLL